MLIKIKVTEELLQKQDGKFAKKGEVIHVGASEAMEITHAGFGTQVGEIDEEKAEAKGAAK